MTAKKVRVKIRSPPASSATTPTPVTSVTTNTLASAKSASSSRCSKCSHCRDRPRPDQHRNARNAQASLPHPPVGGSAATLAPAPHPPVMIAGTFASVSPIPMQPVSMPHEPRLHPCAPAPVLHHLGRGPEPLFRWESVMPLNHTYGQPRYLRRTKPDYRRFCFSVGKADVPFPAMPGGPLWGMDVTMAPQMVGGNRW